MLVCAALAVSACGSTAKGVSTPRTAAPVNLTVYIGNNQVSVSPSNVGAGPVDFIITNQAAQAESIAILRSGAAAGQPLANTGPINPQATAQVTVNFSPGSYSLATAGGGSGAGSTIRAALIHIGAKRASSDNELLQP